MCKFLVVTDKNSKHTAVFVDSLPLESELSKGLVLPVKILCEVPLEGTHLEMFKEINSGGVFDIDRISLIRRSYEFFILGWNTGVQYLCYPEKKMTVDQFRKLIEENPDNRVVALSNFLKYWNFNFEADTILISKQRLESLLIGSFQAGFTVSPLAKAL